MYFGKQKRKDSSGRIPPNQNVTTTFPVLHAGNIPYYDDLSKWNLQIYGLVENPQLLDFATLMKLPQTKLRNDIHCVTGWSKLDMDWEGIQTAEIAKLAGIMPNAKFVILYAEEGWTTNLSIEDFLKESSILAHSYNDEPLTPEHGYPLRAVFPHLYFWKSAKWLRGIQFTEHNHPGFWERNGYHMVGNPWLSERFSWD
ncbi:sulfite oxidase-like oxidoreductase [Metabacillus fastidiosus]|uniref:sulfite oxidase-like oxidoreductase n=1 Tax=Metabacillus fastidiosus TaxID=1458 RepID=UPI0008260FF3|nr:sulfite oxidase-like oxidoreductase [Metabacillus fastidiosus]MED4455233.1 sulfite oxidase-like oxidoreductase [Metabacillus fastidiosus]MED4461421.1 sulfite oxidase-like oxidoreductase [Metabacillus fastidiosus]